MRTVWHGFEEFCLLDIKGQYDQIPRTEQVDPVPLPNKVSFSNWGFLKVF